MYTGSLALFFFSADLERNRGIEHPCLKFPPTVTMEMNSITPEAQSEEIAKKLLKGMKKVTWSIPDRILLQTNEEMSVGRCHPASIMMHSPRLPSMISRKHATVTYISDSQQWAVKDLQVGLEVYYLPYRKGVNYCR